MKCALCKHGQTYSGKTTVTLHRGDTVMVLKGVPADICENCGEYYLSEAIAAQVLRRAEEEVSKGSEVQIMRFAA